MFCRHLRTLAVVAVVCWGATVIVIAQNGSLKDEPNLTEVQKKEFLRTAKVVRSKQLGKGITQPWRLTLSDGTLTHDAVFQAVDEYKISKQFASGTTELNFKDSYHYDIAAYELAKLVGLGDMMPVTVERKWQGNSGALSWWVPWKWDEGTRVKEGVPAPDADAWNKQMYRKRVFAQLVYDTDPNLTNLLITEDWKIWMIDFTRAFRQQHDLRNPEDLVMCDRQLLEKLRQLDATEVKEKTAGQLSKGEIQAVMARRDKIVKHFETLVAQKGEGAVLY
jgi:hypothetical protein